MYKYLRRGLAALTLAVTGTAHSVPIYQSNEATLYMSGYFTLHQVNSRGNTALQDGASRIRFGLNVPAYDAWDVGFNLEWGITTVGAGQDLVIQGDQQASAGDVGMSLFLRQGHGFANHEKWGDIAVGKQWGVYYDVSQITDWYNVSGGLASATYTLGTDGGITGTGRANRASTWRNQWEIGPGDFQVGLQYMAHTADLDIQVEDVAGEDTLLVCPPGDCEYGLGHAISLTYHADIGDGLFIGAAYNRIKLDIQSDRGEVYDITDPSDPILIRNDRLIAASSNSWATVLGLYYGKGAFEQGFYGALVFQRSQNSELAPEGVVMGTTNFFDAKGSESFLSYTWGRENCYSVYGGYNILKSDDVGFERRLVVGEEFRLAEYYLGVQYRWNERIRLYWENGYDDSNEVAESVMDSFMAVGFRIDI
ncbi:porin [Microbulbifer litoralis]|uniref:porin n=1 Tax=Microbulbifer litoralis TaxID=2933965 RepID=UPI0020292B60|nr:porin [Microbulbifer sp. GX H0434]